MKYLKISSLLVLSLLLFVPAALADVTCEIRPNSQRIRMESENEEAGRPHDPVRRGMLDTPTIRHGGDTVSMPTTARSISRCSSHGMLSNDDALAPTLWLVDVSDGTSTNDVSRDAGTLLKAVNNCRTY